MNSILNNAKNCGKIRDRLLANMEIGIIFHVSELKQSIDEQLAVTENEYGSSTKWITETGI